MPKFLSYLFLLIMLFSTAFQGITIDKRLQNSVFIETQEEENNQENYNPSFLSENKTVFFTDETRVHKSKFALYERMLNKEDFSSDIEFPPEKV